MDQLILETIFSLIEDKEIISSSQHGFTKGKSHLTNLINFHGESTDPIDETVAVDIVHLDFSQAFDSLL